MIKCLLILFCLLGQAHAFQGKHYKIKAPKGWSENKGMFGADVIFLSQFIARKQPLQFQVRTIPLKLSPSQVDSFIKKDIESNARDPQMGWSQVSHLGKGSIKVVRSKRECHFREFTKYFGGKKEHSFVGIIPNGPIMHFFMFDAAPEQYKENIKRIKDAIKFMAFK